jgi:hypothetical protein
MTDGGRRGDSKYRSAPCRSATSSLMESFGGITELAVLTWSFAEIDPRRSSASLMGLVRSESSKITLVARPLQLSFNIA